MMVFCGFGGGESSRYEKGGTGHLTCVADAPDGFHTQILTLPAQQSAPVPPRVTLGRWPALRGRLGLALGRPGAATASRAVAAMGHVALLGSYKAQARRPWPPAISEVNLMLGGVTGVVASVSAKGPAAE